MKKYLLFFVIYGIGTAIAQINTTNVLSIKDTTLLSPLNEFSKYNYSITLIHINKIDSNEYDFRYAPIDEESILGMFSRGFKKNEIFGFFYYKNVKCIIFGNFEICSLFFNIENNISDPNFYKIQKKIDELETSDSKDSNLPPSRIDNYILLYKLKEGEFNYVKSQWEFSICR